MIKVAAIAWIDKHRAIVAPAPAGAGLMPGALIQKRLALGHIIRCIAGETAGITDVWIHRRARGAVADGYVALPVHVDAGHPTEQAIGTVIPVLLLGRGSRDGIARHIELIPADCRRPSQGGVRS